MSTPAGNAAPSYIPSLDGLRAVSIAIVFFAHAGLSDKIPGGFGVTVFFFLSGFLITTLLVREHTQYGWIALPAFYARRIVRLAPPLLITLALGILAVVVGLAEGGLDLGATLSQIFFFYNYYHLYSSIEGSVNGLGILWSLSVEEHFYLIYPFVFIAFAKGWIGLRTIIALLVASLAWRGVQHGIVGNSEWVIYLRTDTRLDSMLYGCLLALLIWRVDLARWLPKRHALIILAVSFAALILAFVLRDQMFRSTLRYSVQGLALIPIFYFAVTHPTMLLFRPLNWGPVRKIGQYSYTLYLVHYVIIEAMISAGMQRTDKLTFIPLALVLSLAYAAAMFTFVEKPLVPLRRRLTGHD